jgi:hypothetical protein
MLYLHNTGQIQAQQESTRQDTDKFVNGYHGDPPRLGLKNAYMEL